MTFAQAKAEVNKALRVARSVYRKADTAGEVVERALDRLITKRKTIVTPDQMIPMLQKYEDYARKVYALQESLVETIKFMGKYVL